MPSDQMAAPLRRLAGADTPGVSIVVASRDLFLPKGTLAVSRDGPHLSALDHTKSVVAGIGEVDPILGPGADAEGLRHLGRREGAVDETALVVTEERRHLGLGDQA